MRSDDASELKHPGLIGSMRESLLASLLEAVLPEGHYIGSGKACDPRGKLSKQLDIIIFDKRGLPPYLYNKKEGVFPIHGISYIFEVKSTSTKINIIDTLEKAKSVRSLKGPQPHFVYFAFNSDSTSYESERKRINKELPELDPMVDIICVVGRIYAYWHKSTMWNSFGNTDNFNEIIGLIIGILNTLYVHRKKGMPFKPGEYIG